jgi:predicted nucleotidyltransferase component of viral defense system
MSTTELASRLAVKGGTALKRCYFGGYRFSEESPCVVATDTP